jgi:hypothetical protein
MRKPGKVLLQKIGFAGEPLERNIELTIEESMKKTLHEKTRAHESGLKPLAAHLHGVDKTVGYFMTGPETSRHIQVRVLGEHFSKDFLKMQNIKYDAVEDKFYITP